MSIQLKIKLKSLAAEARIIRQQEQKMRGRIWGPESVRLTLHRKEVVRPEARATHLAYGYLRGRKLSEVEGYSRTTPDWSRVWNMVKRYGIGVNEEEFRTWRKEERIAYKKAS